MGKDALRALETEYPNSRGKSRFLHLDLGDLSTIRRSAEVFIAQEERLDVLTNNAGVYQLQKGETSQVFSSEIKRLS
jgi:retinol dehydrogenase-12